MCESVILVACVIFMAITALRKRIDTCALCNVNRTYKRMNQQAYTDMKPQLRVEAQNSQCSAVLYTAEVKKKLSKSKQKTKIQKISCFLM